jgi:hypothetical protein
MWEVKHSMEFGEHRIVGIVNKREIFIIGTHINRPPTVMTMECFPSNIDMAKTYLECVNAVFGKYEEIIKDEY